MEIVKTIIKYTSYKRDGFEAKVQEDKSITIVTPMGFEKPLSQLTQETMNNIKPLIDFIEADINHSFIIAQD